MPLLPLTINEHVLMGTILKAEAERLEETARQETERTGHRGPQCRAKRELLQLRSKLEDILCRLVPREADPRGLCVCVYMEGWDLVRDVVALNKVGKHSDAFYGWRKGDSRENRRMRRQAEVLRASELAWFEQHYPAAKEGVR